LYRPNGTFSSLIWLASMVGISTNSVAYDFSQDLSPTPLGKREVLQNEYGSALTEDRAIALSIKGS